MTKYVLNKEVEVTKEEYKEYLVGKIKRYRKWAEDCVTAIENYSNKKRKEADNWNDKADKLEKEWKSLQG